MNTGADIEQLLGLRRDQDGIEHALKRRFETLWAEIENVAAKGGVDVDAA